MSQSQPTVLQVLAHKIETKKNEVEALEALHRMLRETYGDALPNEAANQALESLLRNE